MLLCFPTSSCGTCYAHAGGVSTATAMAAAYVTAGATALTACSADVAVLCLCLSAVLCLQHLKAVCCRVWSHMLQLFSSATRQRRYPSPSNPWTILQHHQASGIAIPISGSINNGELRSSSVSSKQLQSASGHHDLDYTCFQRAYSNGALAQLLQWLQLPTTCDM
jgi:hypothetical protein